LKAYETAWRDKIQSELDAGHYARCLFEQMDDADINAAFYWGKLLGIERHLSNMENLSFDWHSNAIHRTSDLITRFLHK
jgi:hypothetical protein